MQQGGDDKSHRLRQALQDRFAMMLSLKKGGNYCCMDEGSASSTEAKLFDSALSLFRKNALIDGYNHNKQRDLVRPVIMIQAKHIESQKRRTPPPRRLRIFPRQFFSVLAAPGTV
jgi:hypothetical protein